MDSFDSYASRRPTADQPLLGLTVLLVEDSRFASEAMRLLCLRSGARLRRADSIAHARQHLRTYRPGVVIVDLGLPDGEGETLIAHLTTGPMRVDVVLGTSGDADGELRAIMAGADGYIAKPIASLGAFQTLLLAHLPPSQWPNAPRPAQTDPISPDPLALREDLAHAAAVLDAGGDNWRIDYVTQFLTGVAATAADQELADATAALRYTRAEGFAIRPAVNRLRAALDLRLGLPVPAGLH